VCDYPQRIVGGAAYNDVLIHIDAFDLAFMATQDVHAHTRLGIPDAQGPISAARDDSIVRLSHRRYHAIVSNQLNVPLTVLNRPNLTSGQALRMNRYGMRQLTIEGETK
jgi:hypothetical protein